MFSPYLGVKLLPNFEKQAGGPAAIYATSHDERFRRLLGSVIRRNRLVAASVVGALVVAVIGMSVVNKQFFPTSDRPEVLVEIPMRTVNTDWGERVPALHFSLDQDRLQSIGLTSTDVAQQLQFLLNGIPVTDMREDIRSVQVTARSAGSTRLDPGRIADFTLVGATGRRIPLSQVDGVDVRMEDPILRRRDRTPTITVRGDIAEGLQPPDVSSAVWQDLQPIIAQLPAGYRIEMAGSIEESGKANRALAPLFPIMIALTLITIIFQVRSIAAMMMVFATAPLGLIGVVPTLLVFGQPFGINALVGLIALSGILMRNTLILIGQIRSNEKDGLAPFDAVVEATVQRARR